MHKNLICGLTTNEAQDLLKQNGYNELVMSKKASAIMLFFSQFKDPMVLILLGASIVSGLIGEMLEAIIIGLVILINAVIGFYQEFKAEKTLESLQKMVPQSVKVRRDNIFVKIPAVELVVGDIVELFAGDKIPADGEVLGNFDESKGIIPQVDFSINESILTGESFLINKKAGESCFMGTIVINGKALVKITHTGMQTKFGEIAKLATDTEDEKSPLQKEIAIIAKFIGIVVTVLCIAILLWLTLKQDDGFLHALIYSVSIAVAAVPEGLITTMTITLAIAAKKLSSEKALIKKLSAIETLGCASVICTDKTGTLTKNEMTVTKILTPTNLYETELLTKLPNNDQELLELVKCGVLCNDASLEIKNDKNIMIGDPTEACLLVLADKLKQDRSKIRSENMLAKTLFFDSDRKMMSTIYEHKDQHYFQVHTKGAPESILSICTHIQKNGKVQILTNDHKQEVLNNIALLQNQAMRVLAFATRKINQSTNFTTTTVENEMIYLGMVGIIDPPREEVKEAIKMTHQAGIKTIMITGDSAITANAIAKEINFVDEKNEQVFLGQDLSLMSDNELSKILLAKNTKASHQSILFARVSPLDKQRIVRILQDHQEIVAVTGDGVNDAPALKKASIGVAMGITGTDVSKEVATLILLDDSFSTISVAIKEGRRIYENMKKFIFYMFATNIGELVAIVGALLIGLDNPLSPVLILLINLVTDIFPALSLGVEEANEDLMKKPPRKSSDHIFNPVFVKQIMFIGIFMGLISLAVFFYYKRVSYSYAISVTFVSMVWMQMVNAYNSKSRSLSVFSPKLKFNPYLLISAIFGVLFSIVIVQTKICNTIFETSQLNISTWFVIALVSLSLLLIEELRKKIAYLSAHKIN